MAEPRSLLIDGSLVARIGEIVDSMLADSGELVTSWALG